MVDLGIAFRQHHSQSLETITRKVYCFIQIESSSRVVKFIVSFWFRSGFVLVSSIWSSNLGSINCFYYASGLFPVGPKLITPDIPEYDDIEIFVFRVLEGLVCQRPWHLGTEEMFRTSVMSSREAMNFHCTKFCNCWSAGRLDLTNRLRLNRGMSTIA